MNSFENNMKRHIFPFQQNQIVILDFNLELEVFRNVMKSLRDIISLTVSISGPSRIPGFGMTVIGQNETIFPLKNLKENYEELLAFVNNCDKEHVSNGRHFANEGSILKCLYAFIRQFNDNDLTSNISGFNVSNKRKLEFTIISPTVNQTLKECREFCRNSNVTNVQKIQIVVPKQTMQEEFDIIPNPSLDTNEYYLEISVEEGIIEVNKLTSNHCIIFEDIFKTWLLDNSLESYHVELLMKIQTEHVISVKCDLQECIINPSTLPQASSIMLEADYSVSRTISYAGNNKLKAVPIYQMQVIGQIRLDGICESLVYGQPLLLKPTMCWRLDLDQLALSQTYFYELCSQLTEANNGLIIKRLNESISSFYLAIPANNYLILKCLTSRELLMPRKELDSLNNVSQHIVTQVKNFLSDLPLHEEYNPIFHESGIYRSNCLTSRKSKRSMASLTKSSDEQMISFGFYSN